MAKVRDRKRCHNTSMKAASRGEVTPRQKQIPFEGPERRIHNGCILDRAKLTNAQVKSILRAQKKVERKAK